MQRSGARCALTLSAFERANSTVTSNSLSESLHASTIWRRLRLTLNVEDGFQVNHFELPISFLVPSPPRLLHSHPHTLLPQLNLPKLDLPKPYVPKLPLAIFLLFPSSLRAQTSPTSDTAIITSFSRPLRKRGLEGLKANGKTMTETVIY